MEKERKPSLLVANITNSMEPPKTRKETRKFSINEQIKATNINKKLSVLVVDSDLESEVKQRNNQEHRRDSTGFN